MFSENKFFTIALIMLVLAGMSLSACAPAATLPPATLPNPTATLSPTETQTAPPTVESTKTMEPAPTVTAILFTETPEQTSDVTDAMLQSDRLEALEATKTLISSLPNASQEEITEVLLRKWLEYYKTDKVNTYFRLEDYKIEQITFKGVYCPPPDKNTRKFLAEVQLSVQTVSLHPGDWEANPNAVDGEQHWIYHLFSYVGVSARNGIYTLSFEGQLGCS